METDHGLAQKRMQETAWRQHLLDSETNILMCDQSVTFGHQNQSLSRYLCRDSSLRVSFPITLTGATGGKKRRTKASTNPISAQKHQPCSSSFSTGTKKICARHCTSTRSYLVYATEIVTAQTPVWTGDVE